MCRLPDQAGVGSNSVAANRFPDSNQKREVRQEEESGGGAKEWGWGK